MKVTVLSQNDPPPTNKFWGVKYKSQKPEVDQQSHRFKKKNPQKKTQQLSSIFALELIFSEN